MKNWLYIPFLFFIALTYSEVSENLIFKKTKSLKSYSRMPASIESVIQEECVDYPQKFNPHYQSKVCFDL